MRALSFATLLLITCMVPAWATQDVYQFDNPEHQALFKEITEELRCVVCQNQNLADSNAEIATDMKAEVYRMVKANEDKASIVSFFVDRYGDFVRYKPAFNAVTAAVWLGPFILMAWLLWRFVLSRTPTSVSERKVLSDEDEANVEKLLNSIDKEST